MQGLNTMETEELIFKMKNSPDAYSRRRAVEELTETGEISRPVVEALVSGLTDFDGGMKDLCSRAVINLPDKWKPDAASYLAPFITSKNIEIRNLAGDILTRLGTFSIDCLLPFLEDEDADNRKFACDIIGLVCLPEHGRFIYHLMEDDDENVVSSSAEAAGNLKDPGAIPKLREVYDNYEELRPIVIDSMGKIGGEEAQQFLINLVKKEEELFLKTAAIDALALCGEDVSISRDLMEELPNVPEELKLILLKTIFAISFRKGHPMELPDDLKYIARKALLEDDSDIRMSGLLAIGSKYIEDDVPGLVNEASYNNPDTQQLIINNLLAFSKPEACSVFFREFYQQVDEDGSMFEMVNYLPMLWPNARAQNAVAAVNSIIDIIFEQPKENSSLIVEVLMRLERPNVLDKIRESLYTGKTGQIKEALDLIDNLSLQDEFEDDLMRLGSSNPAFTEQIQMIMAK